MLRKATTITDLWTGYKDLPTWKKILLFVPLIIAMVFVVVFVFMSGGKDGTTELAVEHNKARVDEKIKDREDLSKIEKAKRKVLDGEIKAIEKSMEIINEEIKEFETKINSAGSDPDKLRSVERDLRAKYKQLQDKRNRSNS